MEYSSKSAIKIMNQEFLKLNRFDGTNFTYWRDKMLFILTALKISYVLDHSLMPLPTPTSNDIEATKQTRKKREDDEFLCRGHLLNSMTNHLYDLFASMTSPKEIWTALDTKYNTEKQGTDKFLISKFFYWLWMKVVQFWIKCRNFKS